MTVNKVSDWKSNDISLSDSENERIQTFQQTYNKIDKYLRNFLRVDDTVGFTKLVISYSDTHLGWIYSSTLMDYGKLRNSIIHFSTRNNEYFAIPTSRTVEIIKKIYQDLVNPRKVEDDYADPARPVEVLKLSSTLAEVLELINKLKYSQFPVRDGFDFKGLLTENGITNYLANYRMHSDVKTLIDFDQTPISLILPSEESLTNFEFIGKKALVDEVSFRFSASLNLEALLVTATGSFKEPFEGIITRWDILHPNYYRNQK